MDDMVSGASMYFFNEAFKDKFMSILPIYIDTGNVLSYSSKLNITYVEVRNRRSERCSKIWN